MIDYLLEYILSFRLTVKPPEFIGQVPEGIRSIWYISGGEVYGPKLSGKLRPGGADWLTIRPDGVGVIDVRATIETRDGALIYVTYPGLVDLGEGAYQKVLKGEALPKVISLRTAPRCSTAHPDYLWLNRLQCVGIGQSLAESSEFAYDVYALR